HLPPRPLLRSAPPEVDRSESWLNRAQRTHLAQVRDLHRIDPVPSICLRCHAAEDTSLHLFDCPSAPTGLAFLDLWRRPAEAINHIESSLTIAGTGPGLTTTTTVIEAADRISSHLECRSMSMATWLVRFVDLAEDKRISSRSSSSCVMQKNPEAKACQTFSIGVIAVASSFSAVSLLFLVLSVATSNWDAVTFNFNLVNTSVMQSASSYYGSPKLLYSDAESTTLTGMILLTSNSTGYCLLNLYSSLWSLCDRVNTEDALNADYDTYCKNFSFLITNNSCFDYISGYTNARDILDATENTAESQIMKMQNNTMACCIVVLICVISSVITGTIGVLAKIVPSIMVTGVLHLTAGELGGLVCLDVRVCVSRC
uniref:Membrane-associated protein n=1 Tax=Macrostomum lignano TaxID=282301 RepID=A0A1I8FT52_9PLAT